MDKQRRLLNDALVAILERADTISKKREVFKMKTGTKEAYESLEFFIWMIGGLAVTILVGDSGIVSSELLPYFVFFASSAWFFKFIWLLLNEPEKKF